jgi:hypothetical protein
MSFCRVIKLDLYDCHLSKTKLANFIIMNIIIITFNEVTQMIDMLKDAYCDQGLSY